MANRLKIYACSGIGDAEAKSTYTYWTDNTNTVENTQAVNTLLAGINSFYTEFRYLQNLTQDQKIWLLNQIDLYTVCLEAAKRFNKHYSTLQKAGTIIGAMLKRGDFDYQELNENKRDAHLDELIAAANDGWESDLPVENQDAEFNAWWNDTIVARNKVGLSKEAQAQTRKVLAKGVKGLGKVDESWKENADLAQYLTKSGTYFLYLFFTDEQFKKLPDVIKKKRQYQRQIYNHCKAYFVDIYGSEDEMLDIIRNGIIEEFKETPEEISEKLASGQKMDGIGFVFLGLVGAAAVKALLEILAIVASVLIGIVTAICTCIQNSAAAKYQAISQAAIDSGCPSASDFDGMKYNGNTVANGTVSGNKMFLWIAGGIAAFLLLRK